MSEKAALREAVVDVLKTIPEVEGNEDGVLHVPSFFKYPEHVPLCQRGTISEKVALREEVVEVLKTMPFAPAKIEGSRDEFRVPLVILLALVVSVVADAANGFPFVFVQVIPPPFAREQSPLTVEPCTAVPFAGNCATCPAVPALTVPLPCPLPKPICTFFPICT